MRLPRWLMEAPYLYPLAALCTVYGGLRVVAWLRDFTITRNSSVEIAYPAWLVVTWVAMLGIGGVLVLLARPWYKLRTEAVGLTLLASGMTLLTIASAAQGITRILGAMLLGSLAFGTWVQLRITWKAVNATTAARRIGGGK